MGKISKRRGLRETLQPAATADFPAGRVHRIWRRHGWRILALWVFVLVAYSNSFQGALVFDNAAVIRDDSRIREATPQNIRAILTGGYWYVNGNSGLYLYRPLTTFSYMLNYAAFGNGVRPAGYHVVNLALHEVNVALVYALGILIFAEPPLALALAAIWGLHPLLTESVTNIVGRADLLAAFGVLAGLLCYGRGASVVGRRRLAWVVALVAAQVVGLFSKESAAVLPGLMLLYDLIWPERARWRGRAPAYAALALPFAVFFCLRAGSQMHGVIDPIQNPLVSAGFWTGRLTAVKVVGKLLWLFLWPARLSADYSFNAVPLFAWRAWNCEDAKAIIALAVCLGATLLAVLLAVRWRRTGRPLLFFLVFFFVALSPTSNLIILIGSIMAERFLYLPSVGLAGCIVGAIYALGHWRSLKRSVVPRAGWVGIGLLCLAFSARTYIRNFDWQDDRSLWSSAVLVCPGSARPHYNLGIALAQIPGRLPEAIAEYRAALRILPDYADAHNNLGTALERIPGRLPETIAEYRAALRSQPNLAAAHYNLGSALAQIPDRLPEAIAEYRAALQSEPDFPAAHTSLGNALAQIPGRLPEAIAEYRAALQSESDFPAAHTNLGNALARIPGRLPEAIAEYRAALRSQPNLAAAHYNLGSALAQIPGRLPETIAEYRAALQSEPNFPAAHTSLGNALAQIPGRLPEAIAEYRAALQSEPDFPPAHTNLGNALARIPGRLPEAIAEYRAALRSQPNLAAAHYNLGSVLARIPGRLPEAIAEYQAALRIRPDPRVQQIIDRLRVGQQRAPPFP